MDWRTIFPDDLEVYLGLRARRGVRHDVPNLDCPALERPDAGVSGDAIAHRGCPVVAREPKFPCPATSGARITHGWLSLTNVS